MPPSSSIDQRSGDEGAPLATWQFVAMADYEPPPPDIVETAKRTLSTFWRRLRPDIEEPVAHVKSEEELTRLSAWRLRRVAPPPAWAEAAKALDTALAEWVTDPPPDEPVRLLVMPPHVGRVSILAAWAEQRGWRVVSPPSSEQILAGGESWFSGQFAEEGPWVLPNLERLYLRHTSGLDLVHSFLDQAHTGSLGEGVLGCDSWAWAFLGHVWRGWLPPTLTLQAYDEGRLARCFRHLARTTGGQPVRFRQSDDGSDVLPPADAPPAAEYESEFLHHLATYCRGNLGVAWAIWRTALRSEPAADLPDEPETEHPTKGQTVWVTPWSRMEHPSLPAGGERDTAFVVHALLLHDGLHAGMLGRLLPLTPGRITETLDALRVVGLVSQDEGLWRVTATGYPPVRAFLETNGYLTDAF